MDNLLNLLKKLAGGKSGLEEKVTLLTVSRAICIDEEMTQKEFSEAKELQIWNDPDKRKRAFLQFDMSPLKGKRLGKTYLRLVNGAGHEWNSTSELRIRHLPKLWEPGTTGGEEAAAIIGYQRVFRVPEWQPAWLVDITPPARRWQEKLHNFNLLLEGGLDSEPLYIKYRSGHRGLEPMLVIIHPEEGLTSEEKLAVALRALKEVYVHRDISWSGSFVRNAQAKACGLGLGEAYLEALKSYFDFCLTEEGQFRNISEVWFYVSACGEALLHLYKADGSEKYKKALTLLRDKLLTLPRSPEGIIMAADRIEVELFFCVLPFLAYYHETFGDALACDLVVEQAITLFDLVTAGMEDGIPLQNLRNPKSKGWSRGMGWLMAGMGKLVSNPGIKEHAGYNKIVERFQKLSRTIADYQLPDGMWRSIIHDETKPHEVTGTALISLGLEYGIQAGVLELSYQERVERALEALPHFSVTGMEMTSCFPMNFEERYEVTDFSGVSDQGYGCWMELLTVRAGR